MENKSVKKVGTLTFHIAHNYGAMLQAYALPKAVESLGHQCEIIHFCVPFLWWTHIETFSETYAKRGLVGTLLRIVYRTMKGEYNPYLKRSKFEHFAYRIMPLSEKSYHCAAEMANMDYDAILFGSDQIWNAQLIGSVVGEYAGQFDCLEKTRKIAYAASCGRSSFSEEEKVQYYPLLKSFRVLGVREQGFCESLCSDGLDASLVLDPTLLLTKEQWTLEAERWKCRIRLPKNKYLLIYAFDEDPGIYDFADTVARKYGLDIRVIAYEMKERIKKYRVYTNCGPEEFVKLFAGASRVVTTSFHGTAFSIIFERDFYCFPHPTLRERTDSLLSILNLEGRYCAVDTNVDTMEGIDWSDVKGRLEIYRKASLQFLEEAIG